jgi:hypothetical protein
VDVPVSECRTCHQPVDLRPLSDAELLEIISACLSAAYDRDPLRVLDVLAVRVPGSTQQLAVAGLALRLLAQLGDRVPRLSRSRPPDTVRGSSQTVGSTAEGAVVP